MPLKNWDSFPLVLLLQQHMLLLLLLLLLLLTLEIESSRKSTIWICAASHSGNEQYTHSPIPLAHNINQSYRCIWYRQAKSVAVLPTWYGKSLIYWLSPLCVQWYFQMHAWCHPSSWAIFITHCQWLWISRLTAATTTLITSMTFINVPDPSWCSITLLLVFQPDKASPQWCPKPLDQPPSPAPDLDPDQARDPVPDLVPDLVLPHGPGAPRGLGEGSIATGG